MRVILAAAAGGKKKCTLSVRCLSSDVDKAVTLMICRFLLLLIGLLTKVLVSKSTETLLTTSQCSKSKRQFLRVLDNQTALSPSMVHKLLVAAAGGQKK